MRIEHVAIWTRDVERLRRFYETYFGAAAGAKYVNRGRRFQSYFLSFPEGGRLELMQEPGVGDAPAGAGAGRAGYGHVALAVGSEERVDELTRRLWQDGYRVADGPRRTGDGYYESVVLDPDGNRVEITA